MTPAQKRRIVAIAKEVLKKRALIKSLYVQLDELETEIGGLLPVGEEYENKDLCISIKDNFVKLKMDGSFVRTNRVFRSVAFQQFSLEVEEK
jgi:hypothetical protein